MDAFYTDVRPGLAAWRETVPPPPLAADPYVWLKPASQVAAPFIYFRRKGWLR